MEIMKVSRYTFFLDMNDGKYLYNTLSNSLIEVDESVFSFLHEHQEYFKETEVLDEETFSALKDRYFITDNDMDDFLKYKTMIRLQREENTSMHLTLAPTMDCCFHCHYCFEKYKDKKHMPESVMDSIIKYIKSRSCLKHINLTWFGGEPLMAIDEIEAFYDKLSAFWDKGFYSNIITTGYHLNENSIQVLKKAKVSSMQITLDGMKETHNKVKRLPGCNDVFGKIMDNIQLVTELAPEIAIVIRVNLTLDNCNEFLPLHDLICRRFAGKKVSVSPAFVLDRGASVKDGKTNLFNHKSKSDFVLKLWKDYKIDTHYVHYPKRFFDECAIRNNLAISFDPEGYAYKCWEVIGNKEYSIGRLAENGSLTDFNEKIFNRHFCGADPIEDARCSKCAYLPICNGGCPIQRIDNLFDGADNDCCTLYKGCLKEIIGIHLEQKRMFATTANRK